MIIIGHNVGSKMEMMENKDLERVAMKKLRNTFADMVVPDPTDVYITRWGRNRHAYGAFSTYALGFSMHDVHVYQRPKLRMYIGGEASCFNHAGLQQGGYHAGERAAFEVLQHMGKNVTIPQDCGPDTNF